MMLTDEQLAEIKRLDAARQGGTWEQGLAYTTRVVTWRRNGMNDYVEIGQIKTDPDAEFIAACSWAIPSLVAEVERLQMQLMLAGHEINRLEAVKDELRTEIAAIRGGSGDGRDGDAEAR